MDIVVRVIGQLAFALRYLSRDNILPSIKSTKQFKLLYHELAIYEYPFLWAVSFASFSLDE